jgi:hypothetical protein
MISVRAITILFCSLMLTLAYAQDNTLESAYSLGRITGSNVLRNALSLYPVEGATILSDGFYSQLGMENSYQYGFYLLGGGVFGPQGGLLMSLPKLNGAFEPSESHRIRFDISSDVLCFIVDTGGFHHPDPEQLYGTLAWDFLSSGGRIAVDPEQYDISFYCGPQVNGEQFGIRCNAQFLGNNSEFSHAFFLPVIGVTDFFQVSGKAAVFTAYTNNIYYNYFPSNNYVYYSFIPFRYGYVPYSAKMDFRLPHFLLNGGWWLEYYGKQTISQDYVYTLRPINMNAHSFFLSGTYVSGNHITSINQVRGNWDGYFSDQLGARQLFARSTITAQRDYFKNIFWQADEVLRYGLLKNLTIGSAYLLKIRKHFKPEHDLRINATLFNVPLREKGPSEVSKFEYEYGYQLKPGEYKVIIAYKVPMHLRKRSDQWYFTTYPYPSELEPQASAIFDNRNYFFDRVSSTLLITDYHFSLKVSAGIGSAFIISDDLGLSKDLYDTNYLYLSPFVRIKLPPSIISYSNTLSITVPLIADRSSLSFAFACMGKTEPDHFNTRGFNYLASIGYFHAF